MTSAIGNMGPGISVTLWCGMAAYLYHVSWTSWMLAFFKNARTRHVTSQNPELQAFFGKKESFRPETPNIISSLLEVSPRPPPRREGSLRPSVPGRGGPWPASPRKAQKLQTFAARGVLLVVMPGATSSVLATSSDALCSIRSVLVPSSKARSP